MTHKIQDVAQDILKEVQSAKRILLHCHPRPDGDSIGSALGLWHALKNMGKDVVIIQGDSNLPKSFSSLPGASKIIPKNITEVDLGKFDLFLILDSAQMGMVSGIAEIKFPSLLKTVVIDHHPSNKGFGDINLVNSTYAATAQMVYDLLIAWGDPITEEIAQCLYIGMWTDTGGFRYPSTTSETLNVAARLVAKTSKVFDRLFEVLNSNDPEHIAFQGLALSRVETFFDDRVAISFVPFKELQVRNILSHHTENQNIANILQTVKGWRIAISCVESQPSHVAISVRTRGELIDASQITVPLGGGGHRAAAGATLHMSFQEAQEKLLGVLGQVLKDF